MSAAPLVPRRLALLFGLGERVDARTYARVGFSLMVFKYAVDALVVWLLFGVVWTPLDYLNPSLALRDAALGHPPDVWFQVAMGVWSLPFLWIGVSMTVRRAYDAGFSPWVGTLFFVPFVNYALMLFLCLRPSFPSTEVEAQGFETRTAETERFLAQALLALGVSVMATLALVLFSSHVTAVYGSSLFAGLPFLLGAVGAFLFNRPALQSIGRTLSLTLFSILVACGFLLLFAIEGGLCVFMILPLAVPVALTGALLGRGIATLGRQPVGHAGLVLLLLPGLSTLEARLAQPVEYEAVTAVEIDAPPAAVWGNVVSFSELDPPTWLPFRLGIAHPVRATIDGRGVGAIRHCEFSTGPFVEPITVWDEPRRLAFDVLEHPAPMHEWSPWRNVHPPHLEGYFKSVRGEFRLIPLPEGRTRLEGSTWYELRLFPSAYWRLWSDLLVHRIHERVLAQVRREAEAQ